MDRPVVGILLGSLIMLAIGAVDDAVSLKWYIKLPAQLLAAYVAVHFGIAIQTFANPNIFSDIEIIRLGGILSPVVTVLWIIGITNAVNLIDGLDGLACGVSGISAVTMLVVTFIIGDVGAAIITAALAGACLGFLPYNFNPAKIFMGDSGAYSLGFILATVSIMGLFKFYAVITFAVPLLVLALPLVDTLFAFLRRIANGQHPMHRDRGHFHHRLIDMGFSQRQAVVLMYAVSVILGLVAIVMVATGESMLILLAVAALSTAAVAAYIYKGLKK
jgi:UDP-GlcNAc:undecaprenyl-phosphate GlcNAc-1-phosphate transferase